MNKFIWLLMLAVTLSCASTNVSKTDSTTVTIPTGWSDDDTYTVQITDSTEEAAVKSAQHRILKDIVDVRVRNNSRYTDIVKIRDEFNAPLRNGIIVHRQQKPDGLTIYYQICDKGLKKKFQRQ